MPEDTNTAKEFSMFGIAKLWRGGFLTAVLTLLVMSNVYLFHQNSLLNQKMVDKQDELYRLTIEYLRPSVEKMDNAASKVDTISTKVDSVTTQLLQKTQEGGVKR